LSLIFGQFLIIEKLHNQVKMEIDKFKIENVFFIFFKLISTFEKD
jgi:hypothetical protein